MWRHGALAADCSCPAADGGSGLSNPLIHIIQYLDRGSFSPILPASEWTGFVFFQDLSINVASACS